MKRLIKFAKIRRCTNFHWQTVSLSRILVLTTTAIISPTITSASWTNSRGWWCLQAKNATRTRKTIFIEYRSTMRVEMHRAGVRIPCCVHLRMPGWISAQSWCESGQRLTERPYANYQDQLNCRDCNHGHPMEFWFIFSRVGGSRE
jgi:hypothetical protein